MSPPDVAAASGPCHPVDVLHAFARGEELPEEVALQVSTHLLRCGSCARTVEEAPPDRFERRLQKHARQSPSTPPASQRLVGDFEILEEIGRGGCGVVYRARQPGTGRLVALKRIKSGGLADRMELLRFQREAKSLAALVHPGIVQVFDYGEQGGEPYLAMELVDGEPLSNRLQRGRLEPREAAGLVARLCSAVAFAHERGIVHRDLKPGNVLLSRDSLAPFSGGIGQPKIVDFGLAKPLAAAGTETTWGVGVGTPAYMAPEQIVDPRSVGPGSDVYALGAILYEALTGVPPVRGASHLEILERARESDIVPPRRRDPQIPRPLEAICLKALEPNPQRRYRAAADLERDLQSFLSDESISARPPGLSDRVRRAIRRHPARTIAILAAGTGAIGLAVHQVRLQREIDRANERTELANAERQRVAAIFLEGHSTISQLNQEIVELMKDGGPAAQSLIDAHLKTTIGHSERLVEALPARDTYADLALAHKVAAAVFMERRKNAVVLSHLEAAADAMREVVRRAPGDDAFVAEAARIDVLRALAILEEGQRIDEGRQLFDDAASILRRNHEAHPDVEMFRQDIDWSERYREAVNRPRP